MKQLKKLVSFVVAIALALSLAVNVSAADSHTLTVNDAANHTFVAYQVFQGTESDGILADVQWGSGVNQSTILSEVKKLEAFKDCENAEAVAKVLADEQDNSALLNSFADVVADCLSGTTSGTGAVSGTTYVISGLADGYYLLVDTTELAQGQVASEYILKVVKDVNVNNKAGGVQSDKKVIDTNDSTRVTTNWQDSADYDVNDDVPFKISATLPANYDSFANYVLTFHDEMSEHLSFNSNSVKVYVDGKEVKTGYQVVTEDLTDECTFEVRFANVKVISEAKAGSTISVEYTAKLLEGCELGKPGNPNTSNITYSNNPNAEDSYGSTQKDTVIVFTYQVDIDKIDDDGNALPGAAFKLEKLVNGSWVLVKEFELETLTTFSFVGLDDGQYRLSETIVPAGYNSIQPLEFTVSAEHDAESENPQLTSLKATSGETELDEGDIEAGLLTWDVVNEIGATLPGTGGMGTTLFYIAGSVLVVGAVLFLITKKRMENE